MIILQKVNVTQKNSTGRSKYNYIIHLICIYTFTILVLINILVHIVFLTKLQQKRETKNKPDVSI